MPSENPGLTRAFIGVTALFFAWGFITATMDPLVPAVRAIFQLSQAEAMLTQAAFFLAYGVVSLPASAIVLRLGYSGAIGVALTAMLVGCLLMPLATARDAYPLVLTALFVIAGGITILQVAANPLSAALGPPAGASFRLTLSQAFNSLGTVLAPYVGARVMLHDGLFAAGAPAAEQRQQSLHNIDTSFMILAGLILALGLFVAALKKRIDRAAPVPGEEASASPLLALKARWALLGAGAIFLYVGAEVSIGSMLIAFLSQGDVLGVTLERAGTLVPLYWGGAMLGRFAGSAVLAVVPPPRVLASAAVAASLLAVSVVLTDGMAAAVAALAIGLMNAIMFPTIFTLTLARSTAPEAATSGLLCMAIVGGAVLPPLAGWIADRHGLHAAFLVPALAYAGITLFALAAARAVSAPPQG
jgi:FHS family L-fucose permease-like MFS transporter